MLLPSIDAAVLLAVLTVIATELVKVIPGLKDRVSAKGIAAVLALAAPAIAAYVPQLPDVPANVLAVIVVYVLATRGYDHLLKPALKR